MSQNSNAELYSAKVRIIQVDVDDPPYINGKENDNKLYKIYLYHEVNGGTHEHDCDTHECIIDHLTVTRGILSHMHPLIDIELTITHPDYDYWVESQS